jgi:GNAT superfamily N-acetyltransferase
MCIFCVPSSLPIFHSSMVVLMLTATQFIYRLASCPELSLGLFSRPTLSELEANKSASSRHRLIAHISATRTPSRSITDATMAYPADWKARRSSLPRAGEAEPQGHQEQGGTVALHSLAVASEHQRKGLGTILLKAYIERIKSARIAERISLLAHDHLIQFYQGFGFVDEGPSEATFGGIQWNSMVSHCFTHICRYKN